MQDKILSVFYGEDRLPYKDASRETHYPIVNGNVFNGANNVTKIRYYLDRIGGFLDVTWAVVSKLPNGQLASEVLNSNQAVYDEELGEHYIDFEISSYYTTLKGDVYLSVQGYQGGVEMEQDEDTGIYSIYGTPTIQATGSIKIGVNYAPQIVQGTHFTTSDLQQVLGLISEKANTSDTIILIDNAGVDISGFNVGQVFFDKQSKSYWVKNSDNTLSGYDVKLERAVTLTGAETIANLILPNIDIANWGIGKYNDTLLFVKVLMTITPTPHLEYTIYQLSNNGGIKCWYNNNATGNETIAQVLATTPTNVYATQEYVGTELDNYYTKSETNNEIDSAIAEFLQNEYSKVNTTTYPTLDDFLASTGEEGYIYLYPINVSDESQGYYQYIWENNAWVSLGSTQIDLSDYALKSSTELTSVIVENKIDKTYEYVEQEITINDDTLMLSTGAIYSGSSYTSFKLIGPVSVSVGEEYGITGFCAAGIGLYIFKDENDNVVSYWEDGNQNIDVPKNVTVPYGATKLYINTRQSAQRQLLKKVYGNIDGNEIVKSINAKVSYPTQWTETGTLVVGKWWQNTGVEFTRSDGMYRVADVLPGEKYLISGMYINTSFVLWEIRNDNNVLIATFSGTASSYETFIDVPLTIPEGGTKLYVNGGFIRSDAGYNQRYPIIQKKAPYTPDFSSIDDKMGKQLVFEEAGTRTPNSFIEISAGKVKVTSFGSYNYSVVNYDATKIYKATGICRATAIPLYVFTDENDYVIKIAKNTVGDYADEEIITNIPACTKKIYVNGYLGVSKSKIQVGSESKIFENPWKDKVGVCFGDSVMQGVGALPSYDSEYANFKPKGYDAPYWIGELLGCSVYNGGLGGGTAGGDRTIDFKNVADCIVSGDFSSVFTGITQYGLNGWANYWYDKIEDLDFSKVDFVLIGFGYNDWNFSESEQVFKNGLRYGIEKILTAYPNIKIYLATPGYCKGVRNGTPWDADTYANASTGLYLYQFVQYVKDVAHEYKLPCVDVYYEDGVNSINFDLYVDNPTDGGPHRNATGYKLLGEQYAKFIGSK